LDVGKILFTVIHSPAVGVAIIFLRGTPPVAVFTITRQSRKAKSICSIAIFIPTVRCFKAVKGAFSFGNFSRFFPILPIIKVTAKNGF